uniref:hypothetical protein n=1 Tax=Streptomyces sp. NRRL S-1448 TaxID=1463883 RepID=UPI00131D2248
VRKAITTLTNTIARKDPRFFAELSTSLRSGNPHTVEQGLDTAGKKLRNLAKNNKDIDLGAGRGLCAIVVVVATVTAATAAIVVKTKIYIMGVSDGTQINKDEAVAALTKQLRTA